MATKANMYLHCALAILCLYLEACDARVRGTAASVRFTTLPPAAEGTPDKLLDIAGIAEGATSDQRIVLYARAGMWWVQPRVDQPFTTFAGDGSWRNVTHPGSAYAALLVKGTYRPPSMLEKVPEVRGDVVAVTVAEGPALAPLRVPTLQFSGYEWHIRQESSDRGGTRNGYAAENAWIDEKGRLHLRLTRKQKEWTSAEVRMSRSLGYGSYRFVVADTAHLEPAAVFSIFTWDDSRPAGEMNIEISRWGERSSRNAQYVVQPYYVPSNVVRFEAPRGPLTHTIRWEPGRATFRTVRGSTVPEPVSGTLIVDEHSFTSGVPAPANDTVRMNLYRFDNPRNPLQRDCEVVIERFEYLP